MRSRCCVRSSSRDAILLLLITSGLAHLPPMKVVTILSGAAGVSLWLFIASAIAARGIRFRGLLPGYCGRYGRADPGVSSRSGLGLIAGGRWRPR